ncbi:MAG: RAMP superfamily CRISPR-associated protein [Candidatus Baldrarchaeia archaeon]
MLKNIDFYVVFLSETLTGEQPTISGILAPKLGKRSVLQFRNPNLQPVLRTTSMKGLIRHAAEFLIEKVAENILPQQASQEETQEGVAVCSYLSISGQPHVPRCILPASNLDPRVKEKMERLKWILKEENKIIYKNYPCLSCSIFGTTGLKSLVSISFVKENQPQIQTSESPVITSITSFYFTHQFIRGGSPLYVDAIKPGPLYNFLLRITIKRPKTPHLHVKSDFDPITVATSVIYLSTLVINSGLFRLGRFKSRGLGWIQLIPKNTDTLKEILKATSNNLIEAAKKVLEEELKSRLLT